MVLAYTVYLLQLFSKRYGVADNGLKSSMLRFTRETLHTSLMRVSDSNARRQAIKVFRCITGFMGDRDVPTPLLNAQELLQEVRCDSRAALLLRPSRANM